MEEQPPWRALTAFHCSHNCISAMDPSLRLLPALQVGLSAHGSSTADRTSSLLSNAAEVPEQYLNSVARHHVPLSACLLNI